MELPKSEGGRFSICDDCLREAYEEWRDDEIAKESAQASMCGEVD